MYCIVLYFVNKRLPWYVVFSYTGPSEEVEDEVEGK